MSAPKPVSKNAIVDRRQHSRRIFPRFQLDVEVTVIVTHNGKEQSFRARSMDISESGMGVTSAASLMPGQMVNVQFCLPLSPREPLRFQAQVRRMEGVRYGLEFLTMSAKQRAAMERFISTLTPFEPPANR